MTPIRVHSPQAKVDPEAMRYELASHIQGEVRFDALSRALYATDASVYQIYPLGVVVPKSRADILHTLAVCRRHGCSINMRGGGTSQAGQSIGAGIQIDTSKFYNRILEVNAKERWARIEPGVVLDELNAHLQPLGLRFAPDISTASRATVGGMVANNSSGARSVLYGKTIDHVLELTIALSDGSVVEFREIPRSDIPQGETLEAACYRTVLDLASIHAAEIDRRFPKISRRVSGYNLDEFTDSSKPVNLAKLIVGSEGTLGIILEIKVRLVPLSSMTPRLYRSARAVALKQGKEIEFLMEGLETEVDRTVFEEISGPLQHLMRNAVNHAIEKPEVRVQNGKAPAGQVKLSALYEGNHVVITVRDDGTGIEQNLR